MKDTFYFSHDYNARHDDKIKRLIMKHGMLGYGIYWALVENLYNNANALRTDSESIAFEMRVGENIINSILNDFDLFQFDDDYFGSLSVQRRLEHREAKSLKAKQSAFKRWNKKTDDANALQTQSECNAIKERKGKERKINKNNIDAAKAATLKRVSDFKDSLYPFTKSKGGMYENETVKAFFNYWSELNKYETKMLWELKPTFEISKRLATWASRENNFNKTEQTISHEHTL
jgi:hypothetical protein